MSDYLENYNSYIGKIIDEKYEIEEEIGEGGLARVFRAKHIHHRRKDAIKILHEKYFPSQQALNRFHREAQILSNIKHRNIVEVFNFNIPTKTSPAYIAMELLKGKSLEKFLQSRIHLPLDTAISVILQICEGVEAAHNKKIIHRDLKPSNIFVVVNDKNDKNLEIKVIDFGLAKPLFNSSTWKSLTKTGEFAGGTFYYMSPEQYSSEKDLDERTDVYSMGLMFYEILSGLSTFNPNSFEDMRKWILDGQPRSLSLRGFPSELADIIEKAYHKDKEKRYANASELKKAIENWKESFSLIGGKYREIKNIKSNTITEILLCEHIYLKTEVMVEKISSEYYPYYDISKDFEMLAQKALAIKHHNLLAYKDYGKYYLVSESNSQQTLADFAKQKGGKLSCYEVVRIIQQILKALNHLHSIGFKDNLVSLDRIWIDERESDLNVKLSFFNFKKMINFYIDTIVASSKGISKTHSKNEVDISPEEVRDDELTEQTNIYDVGVIAYKLLTGTNIFGEDFNKNMLNAVRAVLSKSRTPIRSINQEIPISVATVIEKAINIESEDRWKSASEMRQALLEAYFE